MLEVAGKQPRESFGREVDLLEQERLAIGQPQPLQVEGRRAELEPEGRRDGLAGRLGPRTDQPGLRVETARLHLLGEAQGTGEIDVDPGCEDECSAAASPLEPAFADQLAHRAPDGDQAAAIASGELALGREPVAGAPFRCVEGGLQIEIDLVMERDRAELESEARHRRGWTSGMDRDGSGLAGARIADNVISNGVKSPTGGHAMGVKVAVVGGGSTYTPELVEGFARRDDRLPIDELVLLDIDPDRLAVVGGLARRMLERLEWGGRLVLSDDRDAAIDGADFVLIQLRVGGQAARLVDETLPPSFGLVGQETTGAGGFAKALRTVPLVLELAELTDRRAAPGAWIVDFTNPVGIVTQALLDRGHRAIGLCNVAINIQRNLAEHLGVPADRVAIEHVGLNHLSWERAVVVDGVDRLPGLLAEEPSWLAEHVGMPVELVSTLRAIPSYYLRYYYETAKVVAEQGDGHTRAHDVMDIETRLLDLYRDETLAEKPALLADRGGAFYSEAAAQLIASLHDGAGDTQVVDIRNDGALPDLPDAAVVEIPARIDRDGAHPLPLAPLAPEMRGLVQAAKAYEELAIEAAVSGDRQTALRALLANPLVGEWAVAVPLLDALLEANRALLPRFFGR